jgi:hypothetical protein
MHSPSSIGHVVDAALPGALRSRDLPLPGLILLCLLLIGLYLGQAWQQVDSEGSGWRRIDTDALQRRIDAGDLRDLRADWSHPARPDELPAAGTRP